MISIQEATDRILKHFSTLPAEDISLDQARGRVLANDIIARRTQPPVDLSAMDGYAVRTKDVTSIPIELSCVGEAPAGSPFQGVINSAETVRIFTGGAIPSGADAVVLQEDTVVKNKSVKITEKPTAGQYIRKAGLDFNAGKDRILAGRPLKVRDVGLAAAMNHPWVTVRR